MQIIMKKQAYNKILSKYSKYKMEMEVGETGANGSKHL